MMYRIRHGIYDILNLVFVIIVVLRSKIIRKVLDNLQPLVTEHEAMTLYKFLVFSFLYKILRLIPGYLRSVTYLVRGELETHVTYSIYTRTNGW